jgi:hypothetical protein
MKKSELETEYCTDCGEISVALAPHHTRSSVATIEGDRSISKAVEGFRKFPNRAERETANPPNTNHEPR